ncbi:MAG: hypothetical protein QW666_02410 [Candidatus Woesearchaeota archaeon]
MKQLFCILAFLAVLSPIAVAANLSQQIPQASAADQNKTVVIVQENASKLMPQEHKPFPTHQEKTTTAIKHKKESPGFFAWFMVLFALAFGIGLVIYALLAREKKSKN